MIFELRDLQRFWPKADPAWIDAFYRYHVEWGGKYGIADMNEWRHFLAQTSAETDGLRTDGKGGTCLAGMVENLNYRPASLLAANGYRVRKAARDIPEFRSLSIQEVAERLCADHEMLAEVCYGNRKELGNTQPGDGARYIGRGPLQCTGREIYAAFGKAAGLDTENQPELMEHPKVGWEAAFFEWRRLGCGKLAADGGVDAVSRRVNGGTNGLADRRAWLRKAVSMFPDTEEPEAETAASDRPDGEGEASLRDLRNAGSRSAGHVMTLQRGAVGLAAVSATVETMNQIGDTMQSASGAVSKVTSSVGSVAPIIQQSAEATHGMAKLAHHYVGLGTLVAACAVAVLSVVLGRTLLAAFREGRYVPRGMD